jgi:hypothetical protein
MDLDFALLDITPTTQLGFFSRTRLAELLAFCRSNPEYHIVSFLKHAQIKVNAVVEDAAFYMLGQGDSDPELMYVSRMDEDILAKLKILEFEAD